MNRDIKNPFPDYHEHIMDNSFFPLSDAFWFGHDNLTRIDRLIDGWMLTTPHDAGVLAQMVKHAGGGDHLEIGTAWGGSAILAALVKRQWRLGGKVLCFDPIVGDEGIIKHPDGERIIRDNFKQFGLQDEIELITKPFDFDLLNGRQFSSILIDGGHQYDTVKRDWWGARQAGTKYILVHDYAHEYKHDVVRAIKEDCEGWEVVHLSGLSIVAERLP
jgi:hypothetical protein